MKRALILCLMCLVFVVPVSAAESWMEIVPSWYEEISGDYSGTWRTDITPQGTATKFRVIYNPMVDGKFYEMYLKVYRDNELIADKDYTGVHYEPFELEFDVQAGSNYRVYLWDYMGYGYGPETFDIHFFQLLPVPSSSGFMDGMGSAFGFLGSITGQVTNFIMQWDILLAVVLFSLVGFVVLFILQMVRNSSGSTFDFGYRGNYIHMNRMTFSRRFSRQFDTTRTVNVDGHIYYLGKRNRFRKLNRPVQYGKQTISFYRKPGKDIEKT